MKSRLARALDALVLCRRSAPRCGQCPLTADCAHFTARARAH